MKPKTFEYIFVCLDNINSTVTEGKNIASVVSAGRENRGSPPECKFF